MVSTGELSQSQEYLSFRSSVPLRVIVVDSYPSKGWNVYDVGPKSVKTPLVCLPPVSGTADIFYRQLMGLSAKGYRVISAEHPPYWNAKEWCEGFRKLMDHLGFVKVHIFGASLGGFLAQKYAEYTFQCPRVASLFLCNTYINTSVFKITDIGNFNDEEASGEGLKSHLTGFDPLLAPGGVGALAPNPEVIFGSVPFSGFPGDPLHTDLRVSHVYRSYPSMLLKRMILGNFPAKLMEKEISDSVDFMVEKLENLSRKDLCSRLSIIHVPDHVDANKLTALPVTISDVFDDFALSPTDRDLMYRHYPHAKLAHLKTGGNFPYLCRSDEINMHLQIHLRPFLETPFSARG